MDAASDEPGISRALTALRSLLIPGEELETHAIQRRLFALTHRRTIVGATSGRLIVVARGLFGDYTPQDVRWQDLQDAQLRVGVFGATLSASVHGTADLALAEGSAPRDPGRRPPEGRRRRRSTAPASRRNRPGARSAACASWRSSAPSRAASISAGGTGMAPASAGDDGSQAPAGRLQRAKEMLQQGLLTDAEFEQVKARILSEL